MGNESVPDDMRPFSAMIQTSTHPQLCIAIVRMVNDNFHMKSETYDPSSLFQAPGCVVIQITSFEYEMIYALNILLSVVLGHYHYISAFQLPTSICDHSRANTEPYRRHTHTHTESKENIFDFHPFSKHFESQLDLI